MCTISGVFKHDLVFLFFQLTWKCNLWRGQAIWIRYIISWKTCGLHVVNMINTCCILKDLYMDCPIHGWWVSCEFIWTHSAAHPPELPGMVLAVSGIDPSDASSLELAKAVAESSETSLAGLYTHGGHSYDQVQSLPTEMGRLTLCFVEWSDWKAVKCLLKDLEILSMQINMLFFGFSWLLVF